jgi:hypothetical protein
VNLYLIVNGLAHRRTWDYYESAVVAALSPDQAVTMHPGGEDGSPDEWCEPVNVKCYQIGVASDGATPGVVIASYHAG